MSSISPRITEEDLHALVDGQLDAQRQGQILARLTTSPADHAKVDAWRQQNMLLRAAFAPITQEPMPLVLSFIPCAKGLISQPPQQRKLRNLKPWLLFIAGLILGLTSAGGLWYELQQIGGGQVAPRFLTPQAANSAFGSAALHIAETLDRFLPFKNMAATVPLRTFESSRTPAAIVLQSPDLSTIGMRLTDATTLAWERGPLACFEFLNEFDERFVLCLAQLSHQAVRDTDLQIVGERSNMIIWQDASVTYALSGLGDARQIGETARRIRAALPLAKTFKL
jgi:anti-sigma factor RsiW